MDPRVASHVEPRVVPRLVSRAGLRPGHTKPLERPHARPRDELRARHRAQKDKNMIDVRGKVYTRPIFDVHHKMSRRLNFIYLHRIAWEPRAIPLFINDIRVVNAISRRL